ncbi:MFS general substrate transporter [Ceraceosorus guamensis]|uniref:MFS general substrate transporter n=1 Tax=Ceraceosorus guamensis TaxID=1522189 RepID=A0A316W0H2_9BASI|nr:MFS general substrate transporter [Ceraceosorus guamensis]PWN43024.1 MFS general substrate transporter [Ceraceosorus guamensis]
MVGGGGSNLGTANHRHPHRPSGRIRGPDELRLPMLTLSALGAQSIWSLEMAFASPYLISLGLSAAGMALVFLAGPTSGLIVQPLMGMISDRSHHPWGRRRAFILAGVIGTTASVVGLAWARSISDLLGMGLTATKLIAVLCIFGIDVGVNALNALDRALVLDLVPATSQSLAHAWMARLAGTGSVMGFLIGQARLEDVWPFSIVAGSPSQSSGQEVDAEVGKMEAQLRAVAALTILILVATHAGTAWAADEEPLRRESASGSYAQHSRKGLHAIKEHVSELRETAFSLSRPILDIFVVQFWAWIAWFPFLFYMSLYLSNLSIIAGSALTASTRFASLVMAAHATLSLLVAIFVPPVLQRTAPNALPTLWASSLGLLSVCLLATLPAAIFAKGFSSTVLAWFLVVTAGAAWALTHWAPFAILGVLIQKESAAPLAGESVALARVQGRHPAHVRRRSGHAVGIEQEQEEAEGLLFRDPDTDIAEGEGAGTPKGHGGRAEGTQADGVSQQGDHSRSAGAGRGPHSESDEDEDPEGVLSFAPEAVPHVDVSPDRAGTVLGLHNVAIVLPQFIVTLVSTLIFAILEPGQSALPRAHAATNQTQGSNQGAASLAGTSAEASDLKSRHGLAGLVCVFLIGSLSSAVACLLALRAARRHASVLSTS